jgi:hypothetical protein
MWPLLIVLVDPQIEMGLQLVDRTIHLFAERDTIELVEHGFVEALADAVGLRALGLGARVIDVLDRKLKLVFASLRVATILAAAVAQYAQKLDIRSWARTLNTCSRHQASRPGRRLLFAPQDVHRLSPK